MHWIDPDSLPEIAGVFARFLVNPHGEPDGMLLEDGREVHFPPHMGPEIEAIVKPKTEVRIRALRPRGAPVLAAVRFDVEGRRVEDLGPPDHREKPHPHRRKAEEDGVVARFLHGPKGERRGLMLESGTQVRFPKHLEEETGLPEIGARVAVHGKGLDTAHGLVIDAKSLDKTPDER